MIRSAKRESSYDQGIMELTGARVFLAKDPDQVYYQRAGEMAVVSPRHQAQQLAMVTAAKTLEEKTMHYEVKVDRGMTFSEAQKKLIEAKFEYESYERKLNEKLKEDNTAGKKKRRGGENVTKFMGFYQTRMPFQGKYFVLLLVEKIPLFDVSPHFIIL